MIPSLASELDAARRQLDVLRRLAADRRPDDALRLAVDALGSTLGEIRRRCEQPGAAAPEPELSPVEQVLERVTDGFLALDPSGRFTYVNASAERLLARPRAELLGRSLWSSFPEVAETAVVQAYRQVAELGAPLEIEERLPPHGRWFQLRIYPAPDGLSVYLRDVTERRRAEQALRESELRFRLMVEGSEQVFFYEHDEAGRFTYLSPSVRDVLGYAPGELLGLHYDSLKWGDESDVLVDDITRSELRDGVVPLPYEVVARHRSGHRVVLELVEQPVQRDAAVVQGFARDVTHRRELEAERSELLARERAARVEAERAIRRRDQVLAVVSHDLRNPIGAVELHAGILRDLPLPPERRVEQVERILQITGRMQRLVQGLLDTARLDSGHGLPIRQRRVALASLVEEAMHLAASEAASRRIELHLAPPPADLMVWADEDRVLQVLWNLTGNALKFTPPGGRIRVDVRPGREAVWIRVTDSGPGIAADEMPRLFEPFWQADRSTPGGVGLGLAIARAIVEAHGGRLEVDSTEGEGTTFRFCLPYAAP